MELILKKDPALKLKYFVDIADGEISGMAKSVYDEENDEIIVEDLIIFEQECTAATTDISDESMAKFLFELSKNGEDPSHWNLWWHSHADMDVFWSGTDDATIQEHIGTNDYLISLVANKKGELKARLDVFPTDKSHFKKVMFKTYDLIPKREEDEITNLEAKAEIEEIEELKKLAEKEHEEIMAQAAKRLLEIRSVAMGDVVIKEFCEAEVADKVKKKTWKALKPIYSSGSYPNYPGYLTQPNFNYNKKKETRRKKGKNYYNGENDRQEEFEKILGNVVTINNEEHEYVEDVSEGGIINYGGIDWCETCDNPSDMCTCNGFSESFDNTTKLNKHLSDNAFEEKLDKVDRDLEKSYLAEVEKEIAKEMEDKLEKDLKLKLDK